MISYLRGKVADKALDGLVLDVGGVGYGVRTPSATNALLSIGQQAQLSIYEHIKEDSYDLYGFAEPAEKDFFVLLLGVNGVGAKMALSIMNVGPLDNLKVAIAGGDTKYIQTASGVGKRLAERPVVDLKDKVGITSVSGLPQTLLVSSSGNDEASLGLQALGYSPQDAAEMLVGIDPELGAEERINIALRGSRA